MTKRRGSHAHYEKAFEQFLRKNQLAYIAVNEAKRPIVQNKLIKNFDFVVAQRPKLFLIDIKGKQFPYSYKNKNYWENWITKDDIKGLLFWKDSFRGAIPLIVFVYSIIYPEDLLKFNDVFKFKNKKYGLVAIRPEKYLKNSKPRSGAFNAICVSREKFSKLVSPISNFIKIRH